jgi:hypothetical protein
LLPTESLRFIDCPADGGRKILSGTDDAVTSVAKSLGVLPDHDVRLFVGVEGINDINFWQGISQMLHAANENVPNLKALEESGQIVFVPLGGSNLGLWASRLANFNRPEFHLYDRDTAPPQQPKYHAEAKKVNERDNCVAHSTSKLTLENYLHPNAITAARSEITITFGDYDNVPELIAKAYFAKSNPGEGWDKSPKDNRRSNTSNAKKWLNQDAVANMTPDLLTEADPSGDVRGWLAKMGEMIAAAV